MKKFKPYGVSSTTGLVLSLVLSRIFGFSLQNTWQAFVALLVIFGPLWVYGWKASIALKRKHHFTFLLIRLVLFMLASEYLLIVVLYLTGAIS